jgi:hypothetical protein
MTLVNPVQPNATEELLKVLQAGEDTTAKGDGAFPRIAGFKLKKGVEVVRIEQIDRDGKVIDWFELKGAFPTNINFGRLDYSSDTPVELSITWEYTAFNAGARETTILDSGYRSTEVSGMDCAIGLDGTMT